LSSSDLWPQKVNYDLKFGFSMKVLTGGTILQKVREEEEDKKKRK